MATYRVKQTTEAEQYDGSSASVERIMDMLGRTAGIMNTSNGYMLLDGRKIPKGHFVHREVDEFGDISDDPDYFNYRYEKID